MHIGGDEEYDEEYDEENDQESTPEPDGYGRYFEV
jgi:hypothetical protein